MSETRLQLLLTLCLCSLCLSLSFAAPSIAANITVKDTVAPPEDPTQSITYWKPFTITPQNDPDVANAHQVFSALLRGWDSSRVEPNLYVVSSTAGPWAASLSDGNILLSQQAIEICNSFGKDRSRHLLAFVLAHELAHQRADDLWHQKFFRMVGSLTPELTPDITPDQKRKLVNGLNSKTIIDLERREAQADNDGLILMSTVGYDPYKIIDKKDFFTAWVENIWQASCTNNKSNQNLPACNKAKSRALRTRAQLIGVATQATLFELGTQSFIAGKYPEARRYFEAYGRDYPSRAVHSNIGLSYLAQALEIKKLLITTGAIDGPNFFYPMMLDAAPQATPVEEQSNEAKRGAVELQTQVQKKQISHYIEKAINYFEKSIRLEPNHRNTYLYLAMSYLIDNNVYMARGVVQGKFIPKFGHDTSADLLIAMTSAIEGKNAEAQTMFDNMLQQINEGLPNATTIEKALLIYSAFYNYSALLDKMDMNANATALWKKLAKHAKTSGNSILFQLAIKQIRPNALPENIKMNHPVIQSLRPGDTALIANATFKNISKNEIWLEGEQLNVYRFNDGARIVTDPDDKVIGAWQNPGNTSKMGNIRLGDLSDRPIKTFGLPSRHMQMVTGEYLAYDAIGLAIHIVNGKVAGWFLYDPA